MRIAKIWTDEEKEIAIGEIFSRMGNGESVRSILDSTRNKEVLPSRSFFYNWLKDDKTLEDQYAHAYEDRQDFIFEEILTIADDDSEDSEINEKGTVVLNTEFVARSKVRIGARQWVLGRMNSKKYGDRMDLTSDGDKITQPQITVIHNDKKVDLSE